MLRTADSKDARHNRWNWQVWLTHAGTVLLLVDTGVVSISDIVYRSLSMRRRRVRV